MPNWYISNAFWYTALFEMPPPSIRGLSIRGLHAMHPSICRKAVQAGKLVSQPFLFNTPCTGGFIGSINYIYYQH